MDITSSFLCSNLSSSLFNIPVFFSPLLLDLPIGKHSSAVIIETKKPSGTIHTKRNKNPSIPVAEVAPPAVPAAARKCRNHEM